MTGKRWLLLAVVGTLLGGSGCVSCNHQAQKLALDAGPDCPILLADRQRVYLFMVNGTTPCGLDSLRDVLARQGYPKVASAQFYQVVWLAREMRRIHCEDPAARFVVLGYSMGGPAAARLAVEALAEGLPIDALILLDPVGKPDPGGCPIRTLLVNSGSLATAVPHSEGYIVPDSGHFRLPSHPQTVAIVVQLLSEVAALVGQGEVIAPVVEWLYEDAPPLRAFPVADPNTPPEWNFLLDLPGNHTERLLPVDAPPVLPPSGSQSLAPGLQAKHSVRPQP
jgi:hypothetical protein